MAFPLGAIGTGLSLLGGLSGLFGASAAERRAREASERAIRELESAGDIEYESSLLGGRRDLYGLQGTLSDVLASGGRGLGSALAGAGVYNSSAAAGAIASEAAANAATVGRYSSGLADLLARIRASNRARVAQMRFGFAGNELDFARQQQASAVSGLASTLGSLGQLNLTGQGVNRYNPNQVGEARFGTRGSVLDLPDLPELALPPGLYETGYPLSGLRFRRGLSPGQVVG